MFLIVEFACLLSSASLGVYLSVVLPPNRQQFLANITSSFFFFFFFFFWCSNKRFDFTPSAVRLQSCFYLAWFCKHRSHSKRSFHCNIYCAIKIYIWNSRLDCFCLCRIKCDVKIVCFFRSDSAFLYRQATREEVALVARENGEEPAQGRHQNGGRLVKLCFLFIPFLCFPKFGCGFRWKQFSPGNEVSPLGAKRENNFRKRNILAIGRLFCFREHFLGIVQVPTGLFPR